jgi:hypothetical protein
MCSKVEPRQADVQFVFWGEPDQRFHLSRGEVKVNADMTIPALRAAVAS